MSLLAEEVSRGREGGGYASQGACHSNPAAVSRVHALSCCALLPLSNSKDRKTRSKEEK